MIMEWKPAIDAIEKDGLAVIDDFFESDALRTEAQERFASGHFRPAAVGKKKSTLEKIRSDQIEWWEATSLTPVQNSFVQKLDLLREACNRELFLGLFDWEGHYAHYDVGAYYEKHLDRFEVDDRRTLSTVFYLNESWESQQGGQLVVYPPKAAPRAILPLQGRLVVFLSDRIPHEVKPAGRERLSVTGWFRRRPTL